VVGARNASASGVRFARGLAQKIGEADYVVASGLARGIDTAAHRGALATGTIAVIAGGVDVVYPPENQALYDDIVGAGLAVSEMPLGTVATARHFPRRNRLISGLSLGVVVVEAAPRSGSLITARMAAEQGREVFAVPGSPLDPRARGANGLIRQGAQLTESADDVLDGLARMRGQRIAEPPPEAPPRRTPDVSGLDDARGRLQPLLGPTPVEVDELIRQAELTPQAVITILLELDLAGRLDRHPGNRVSLR
jgi:DNA processing protein